MLNPPPRWHGAVPGVVFPVIGTSASAHLQSLLFQLEQSQWLTPEQLRDRQLGQVELVLRHAMADVPHYAKSLRELQVRKFDWKMFGALPLLGRDALQENFEALCSRRPPPSHGTVAKNGSSGSTGMPVNFLGTGVTQLFWEALTLREHFWHQRDFNGKLAALRVTVDEAQLFGWGPPVTTLFKSGPAATLNVGTDVAAQLNWLLRETPDYLITHPSNLGALVEMSIQQGLRLPGLRQVRTSGEALRPDLRERVRLAWNVGLADIYSCSETGLIALQCPDHDHYHVQSENLIVEVLHPDGSACQAGETGEVVLTTLHNFAMPLIRYRVGDFAEVGAPCPCGRGLPVLKQIHGRQRNMLKLPDGTVRWPSFPGYLWQAVAPVKQFQLIQFELDRIEARYVMERELTTTEATELAAALQEKLGFPFRIDLTRVPAIDRGASYKFEDFISRLPAVVSA